MEPTKQEPTTETKSSKGGVMLSHYLVALSPNGVEVIVKAENIGDAADKVEAKYPDANYEFVHSCSLEVID
jgi:hypothetical protein